MSSVSPQTEIVLCNHVPFDKSYKTSVLFDSVEEQQAFFRNRAIKTIPKNTYQRTTYNSFKVQARVDDLIEQGINYCFWCNKDYSSKYYYAFVTSLEYVNPNTTIIYYELDNIQTYMFDLKFQTSYFERKHYDLGDRDSEGNLTSFTCPLDDEGLNYGNIYKTIKRENLTQIPDVSFVMLASTSGQGFNRYAKVELNLNYMILPVYVGRGYYQDFKLNEKEIMTLEQAINLFRNNSNYVGTLVSITLLPFLPISNISYEYKGTIGKDAYINIISTDLTIMSSGDGVWKYLCFMDERYEYGSLKESGKTLANFPKFSEQKLYMSPYSFNVLSTDRGNELIVKNEYLNEESINVSVFGTIATQNKQMFIVNNYNGYNGNNLMDNGIVDESNSSLPIIDDYTASYIQSNKNSIQVARSNALATMNASVNSAMNNFASNNIANQVQKKQAQNTYDSASYSNLVNLGSGLAQGAVTIAAGAFSTNAGGNVASGVNTILQSGTDYLVNENATKITLANALLSNYASQESALNTKASALFTANTDYQNTIATLNAKYEDAQAIADTSRSLGNDYIFNVANGHDGLYLYKKTIRDEYVLKLTNYFKMYGYISNEMGSVTEAINSREQYNYVKLVQLNVTGNLPQDKIMAIQEIFINGITFFHELKHLTNQESDYACAYTNLANSYDECMYSYESNVPRTSSHNLTIYVMTDTTASVDIYENGQYSNSVSGTSTFGRSNSTEITLKAHAINNDYKVVGYLFERLGCYYEGEEVTIKMLHDDSVTPIVEHK